MSRLVSRILLSIFMFPLAGVLYILVAVVGESVTTRSGGPSEVIMFAVGGSATWAFVALYWCLLWRASVRWNPGRIAATWMAAGGALVGGAVFGAVAAAMVRFDGRGFGTFIGGVLAIILWLIATVLIWRETPAERAQRISASGRSTVTCPTCGYNLTGLSESRCPECGSKFTLDELMASQTSTAGEIE